MRAVPANEAPNDTADSPNERGEPVVAESLLRCIEALLMAADGPLTFAQLTRLLETTHACSRAEVRTGVAALVTRYADAAVNLVEIAGGWRFQVGPDYAALVSRLWEERPPKLSGAMLETLALICYRQPLARSDIEAVRGVSVSTHIIRTLQDYDWIKVVGHREVPGRPALYATTARFLDDLGVRALSELPALPEINDPDALAGALPNPRHAPAGDAEPSSGGGQAPEADPDGAQRPGSLGNRGFDTT